MVSVKEFIDNGGDMTKVSVSQPDQSLAKTAPHEFEQGFIARNPKNHEDLWYVAKKYFDDNLEEAEPATATTGLTFWKAAPISKERGVRIARQGWNGLNMWVTFGKGNAALPAESFWNEHSRNFAIQNGGSAPVGDYWLFKSAQGTIEMGWRPTSIDMFAEDWMIVD